MAYTNYGSTHHNWTGGRVKVGKYMGIRATGDLRNHHRKTANGYILEHLLVAERVLGRPLRGQECVHHIDGNGCNNQPSNLVICPDQDYHKLIHRMQRYGAVKPGEKVCTKCLVAVPLNGFAKGKTNPWCKECVRIYSRERRLKKKQGSKGRE